MAASILSFGMLTARALWMTRRNVGFAVGSGPPAFTAMVMSLAMRANSFAMRVHRANIVCLRTSKMRPMKRMVHEPRRPCQPPGRTLRRAARLQVSSAGAAHRAVLQVETGSGQLRLQQPHAPQLQAQAALDLVQTVLQLNLLPLLEHCTLFLTEPLLFDTCPLGDGREEALVF